MVLQKNDGAMKLSVTSSEDRPRMISDDQELSTPSAVDRASERSWINTNEISPAMTVPKSGSEHRRQILDQSPHS